MPAHSAKTARAGCPAGHELPAHRRGSCAGCRRERVVDLAAAADPTMPRASVAAAVDAVAAGGQALGHLERALAGGPLALQLGAPPIAGRLTIELIACGSAVLTVPRCARCARTGKPLTRGEGAGVCQRCRAWQRASACSSCGRLKPVAARDAAGGPICEPCRRHTGRADRTCGRCGKTAPIALRGRNGAPDLCVNCYRMPDAVCSVCGKHRECNFADTDRPICPSCSPKSTAACARCGAQRPPAARWSEGPVCDPCYTAALRHRGRCSGCGEQRRLVAPPGPHADTCADCAGLPVTHTCTDCGIEDKLYEQNRCARCSLRRRTTALLTGADGQVPARLASLLKAICAARNPRSALNWLARSHGAALLADLAAGTLPATHQALDAHPRRRAADFLRHMLTAADVLAPRDEELTRTEQWLDDILHTLTPETAQRQLRGYATWQVMRRLRASAQRAARPRSYTGHARRNIRAAAEFLAWLHTHDRALTECTQADADTWLATGPAAGQVRDFLTWAARHGHSPTLTVAGPTHNTGTATNPDQRWTLTARLLHDETLDPTDRAAGCLLLLYGQQLSRIAAITTNQIATRDGTVHVQLGEHDIPVPDPLGKVLTELARNGRAYTGTGSPTQTDWLFPGGLPGKPITASRLGERLRALGIRAQAGRRAALIDLAAQLPAAVLADLLGLAPTTAVKWMRQAGGDWSGYAAELARARNHHT
jgi:hypothetical protein